MGNLSIELVFGILLPYAGELLGSYFTRRNMNWYNTKLKKPWWRPPNWLFGPVWTVLYGSMGYASYLVWKDGGGFHGNAQLPLLLYGIQLALNWAYTPILFGSKNLKWATIDIVALDVAVVATVWTFYGLNADAAYLMLPYLGWCAFATVLTKWIYASNDKKDKSHTK